MASSVIFYDTGEVPAIREYNGDFEVHLTARTVDQAALDRFRAWCGQRGWKCVHIVLARGSHVDQPMATWRLCDNTLPAVLTHAQQEAHTLSQQGLPVVRVKIEAGPHNLDVPRHDRDAAAHDAGNYFEHHVKLRRPALAPQERLWQLCDAHTAHLSRNAFRRFDNGMEERFVTLRSYGVGWETTAARLQELLHALKLLGEEVIECESEYCVYDSNLELDAGWLPSAK